MAQDGVSIDDLAGQLVRDTFGRGLTDADAFLVFLLFHTHRIVLAGPILTDRPGVTEVDPDTQWGVSEALASAWKGTQNERANPSYWYFRWNGDWGSYHDAERLSSTERGRLEQWKAALESHPWVTRLEPED